MDKKHHEMNLDPGMTAQVVHQPNPTHTLSEQHQTVTLMRVIDYLKPLRFGWYLLQNSCCPIMTNSQDVLFSCGISCAQDLGECVGTEE